MQVTSLRNAIVVIIAMLVLPCTVSGAASRPKEQSTVYDIPRLDKLVIDGKADDWGPGGGFRVDLLKSPGRALKPVSDHDARLRLGWNDDGLAVLVTVRDDKWIEHNDKNRLWRYDGVEVFLAPGRGAKNVGQWCIAPGMSAEHKQLRWNFHDYRTEEAVKKLPADLTAKRTKTRHGYVLEMLVPWKSLAIVPKPGREVAFQIWVNDADDRLRQRYRSTWFPETGAQFNAKVMHRLRLAKKASPSVSVRARIAWQIERLKVVIWPIAAADLAGKTVSVMEGGRKLGQRKLEVSADGRAGATLRVPFPPKGKPYGPITLLMDGRTVDTVNLPNSDHVRAGTLIRATPIPSMRVFADKRLPWFYYEHPLMMDALIGPHEIKATYYDKDYNLVTGAVEPGRYGAVVEVIPENGPRFRRFRTIFRAPKQMMWWRQDWKLDLTPLQEMGIRPEAIAAHKSATNDFFRNCIMQSVYSPEDRFGFGGDIAVLLAGLYETKTTDKDPGFYDSPRLRDHQWWVGLKRKLYGWDKRWPKPFVCPRPIRGKPATVVRKGTLKEAGMKADAAKNIDAVLTAWAADSDQAFAVCIVRHGVIVLHKAYGTRGGKPMTVTTVSDMRSATKMISGALIMMLVDQGLLTLDDDPAKFLPPLRGIKTNQPLTIRHLYTHTYGIDLYIPRGADMEERIVDALPYADVGGKWKYSATGMYLTCKILEGISGESLPNFYRKHLFGPLGCDNTRADNPVSSARSVPLDMARIGQMLLNQGAYGKMRFMRPETFRKMLPERLVKTLGENATMECGIGTTWFKEEGLGKGTFGHGAASSATVRVDPENDMVVIMTRNAAGKNFGKYHQKFLDAVVAGIAGKGK